MNQELGPDYRKWPMKAQLRLRDYLQGVIDAQQPKKTKILVDKSRQRIRLEDEKESSVVIVIEPNE